MHKSKINTMILILGSVAILAITGLLLNQIHKNHVASQLIIEKCFENFDDGKEVVIKKEGFWSPVTCENN